MHTDPKLIPDHRPRIQADEIEAMLAVMLDNDPKVHRAAMEDRMNAGPILVGVRGYFRNSIGLPGVNDLGVFDDAILVRIAPGKFVTFNANVDPSRAGYNKAVHKLYAQLDADQIIVFRQGRHRLTPKRLRQMTDEEAADAHLETLFAAADPRADGEFKIQRIIKDGVGEYDTGCYNINIHGAAERSTSSFGCQTLPVEQETEFFDLVYAEMTRRGLSWETRRSVVPYFFTDRKLK